jgi:hypothetical protein
MKQSSPEIRGRKLGMLLTLIAIVPVKEVAKVIQSRLLSKS